MNARRLFLLLLPVALMASFTACEGIEDDDGDDFVPTEGKGALFINNDSFDQRIHIYVDGERQPGRAGGGSTRVYELDPGEYRVFLVDSRTDRVVYNEDVSILAGRVWVLDVTGSGVDERLE